MDINPKKKTPISAAFVTEALAQARKSLTTSGESRTSFSKTLGDLPNELMEIIFSNLCDGDSYPKDLMTCRAVNQRWKSIIDGMMERACHKSYLSLQPTYQLKRQLQYPIIPSILTLPSGGMDFGTGACPEFLVSKGRLNPSDRLPVPTLRLVAITLPAISGGGASICVVDLISILSRTPNLKGFVLEEINVTKSRSTSTRQELPPLPELTSLKIRQNKVRREELFDGLPFTCWLLKAYSKQLTCLEVESRVYKALTFDTYPKLQELQFGRLNLTSLLPSDRLPIRRLIIKDVVRVQDTPGPFMKLATFFHSFEDTLEHLELPSLIGFEDSGEHLKVVPKKAIPRKGPGIFPKLKVFGFSIFTALHKDYFLPKFSELETMEVMDSGLELPTAAEYKRHVVDCVRRVTDPWWQVSPKLKRVRVFPDLFGSGCPLIYRKDLEG
ncbi:unnamed protein product [Orchesella dallaii]|uniref:F-box domain-containing protein n=1 Tax=Orchesella dallaii TaxID=48710 RepID=A0ABP1RPH9_9HEXA